MLKPENRGTFPEVIDSTIIAEWKSCPTKCFYSHFRHLGSPIASTDLIAGGAYARGLEVFRKEFYGNKLPLDEAVRKAVPEIIVAYGDHVPDIKKEAKSLDRVIEGFVYYLGAYPPATDHIQPYYSEGKPSVEYTFSIPLPLNNPDTGQPLIYGGRFDMLGVYRDMLLGLDDKTTTQLGDSWAGSWHMRGQFSGYTWAARQYGLDVKGIMVRGLAFLKRGNSTAEVIELRDNHMVDSWYEETLYVIADMIQAYNTRRFHHNFADSCHAYFRPCVFMPLCQSPDPESWIPGRYGERKWNPLDKNPVSAPEVKAENVSMADAMKGL